MAANNDYAIETTFLDTNLFSGSAESFRTAMGLAWSIGSSSAEGEVLQFAEGESAFFVDYMNRIFNQTLDPFIEKVAGSMNNTTKLEASEDVLCPAYRIPIRITGDPTIIQNDLDWKAIVMGKTYADASYPGLYSAGTFDCTPFRFYVPYPKQEVKFLVDNEGIEPTQQIEISYNYHNYLEEYENYIATLDSETLIPNSYFFEVFKGQKDNLNPTDGSDPSFKVEPVIAEFASLDILTDDELSELYDPEITSVLPHFNIALADLTSTLDSNNTAIPNSTEYYDKTLRMRNYLTGTYAYGTLPPGPAGSIPTTLKNILFDEKAFESGGLLQNMEDDIGKFPYYIKINFPLEIATHLNRVVTQGSFKEALVHNNFSQKFMKTLKEVFLEETSDTPIETIDIIKATEYNTVSGDQVRGVSAAETTTMKAIDLLQMLTNCYNNYNSQTENCYFIGETTDAREGAMVNDNSERYENTINTLGVLEYLDSLMQLYLNAGTVETVAMEEVLLAAGNNNLATQMHTEAVVYRIEKLGGAPLGDNFSQGALQNYWFFAKDAAGILNFYDSQVKYGTDYTYRVYAYVAVVGQKYEYSDMRLTRKIGTGEIATFTDPHVNCLEFYDPNTGEAASQLFDTEATMEAYRTLLPQATDAQMVSSDSYVADFYLTWSPTLKIIEVPLYSKTLQVLDNPGSNLDVIPYQILDDSQTIGFVLNYEFFVKNSFPYSMTAEEAQLKTNYQNANDFTPGEEITKDSVSKARYVEVYRMDTKPTAVSDFSDHVYERIDLRLPNTKDVDNIANFVDKIRTNHAYYYLFRVLNEHNIPSHISEIYETTLVNDGGYKYATFNTLFEEDLKEDAFTEPSKFFKKLIHLKPNTSHLAFDSSDVDFAETASSQISDLIVGNADDTLWGKTFKIRMTSKKTGKKIDLNITYNLENDV